MTATPQSRISTRYLADVLQKLHPTFRTRTYRDGSKVVFMTIRDAKWSDLYPGDRYPNNSDLLSYGVLWDYVRRVIPDARFTSGGAGGGTWRLPSNVVHLTGTLARKKPDQLYRTLHRFSISLRHADGQVAWHTQKDRGDRDPVVALGRAFAALAQLLTPGDRDVVLTVTNRGTGTTVLTTPVIALTPTGATS